MNNQTDYNIKCPGCAYKIKITITSHESEESPEWTQQLIQMFNNENEAMNQAQRCMEEALAAAQAAQKALEHAQNLRDTILGKYLSIVVSKQQKTEQQFETIFPVQENITKTFDIPAYLRKGKIKTQRGQEEAENPEACIRFEKDDNAG